jgi:hypothetical protein
MHGYFPIPAGFVDKSDQPHPQWIYANSSTWQQIVGMECDGQYQYASEAYGISLSILASHFEHALMLCILYLSYCCFFVISVLPVAVVDRQLRWFPIIQTTLDTSGHFGGTRIDFRSSSLVPYETVNKETQVQSITSRVLH